MVCIRKKTKGALPVLGACLLASIISVLLTGWLSMGICLWNFAPETLMIGDFWAPLCGLFLAGWMLKRASWRVGVCAVTFWLAAWLLLMGRFSPSAWWHDGVGKLNYEHFFSWFSAILFSQLGGIVAARARSKRIFATATALVLFGLWGFQWLASPNYRTVANNAQVFSREESDGTQARVLSYKLSDINAGIYDAHLDDAQPFDDKNASWLRQAMPLVWQRIEMSNVDN